MVRRAGTHGRGSKATISALVGVAAVIAGIQATSSAAATGATDLSMQPGQVAHIANAPAARTRLCFDNANGKAAEVFTVSSSIHFKIVEVAPGGQTCLTRSWVDRALSIVEHGAAPGTPVRVYST